jgi:transcriptional regulator with XRE-family HTH domain
MKVGARFKALRLEHGLTQGQVATALQAKQQEVSRIENGRIVNANLDVLDALARIYHYTLADLLRDMLPEQSITSVERALLVRLRVNDHVARVVSELLLGDASAARNSTTPRSLKTPVASTRSGQRKKGTESTA